MCLQFMIFKKEKLFLKDLWCFCFQLRKLQAVVCEKDVRFQEQIQKHEEELLRVTAQSHNEGELQQVQDPADLKITDSYCVVYSFKK